MRGVVRTANSLWVLRVCSFNLLANPDKLEEDKQPATLQLTTNNQPNNH